MADWSDLPPDLIASIAKHLKELEDFLSFSSVCRPWRSQAVKENWWPGRQLPWLMLAEDHTTTIRRFYNLYKNKLYHLDLPEARGRRCWGSPHGWICTMGLDLHIHLLNPITRTQILLPPQSTFDHQLEFVNKELVGPEWYRDIFMTKLVIFREEEAAIGRGDGGLGLLIVAIYDYESYLAFARPGDEAWTSIDSGDVTGFRDVMFCNGQLFLVDTDGDVYICHDLDTPKPKAMLLASPLDEYTTLTATIHSYLVNTCLGDLWVVVRSIDEDDPSTYNTSGFIVLEFNFDTKKWTELDDLGDIAIFVGQSSSMSLLASEVDGCKPNHIYFTDDYDSTLRHDDLPGGHDMGVFNFHDKRIHSVYVGDHCLSVFCNPIWIVPSIYKNGQNSGTTFT